MFVWLARRTLAEAHLEHPEESDHGIEGIVPLREAALNVLSEAIRKHDFVAVSPTKKQCPELTPVTLVALAAERVLGEPTAALSGVRLGNDSVIESHLPRALQTLVTPSVPTPFQNRRPYEMTREIHPFGSIPVV